MPHKNRMLLIDKNNRVYPLEEKLDKYIFHARIKDLKDPVSGVILSGRIAKVFNVLVKKCKTCNGILIDNKCLNGHSDGFYYDLRMSFILEDDTGAVKCVAPRELTAKLLGIPLSTAYDLIYEKDSQGFSIILTPKSGVRVDYYRSGERIEGYFYDEAKGLVAILEKDHAPEGLDFIGYEYVKNDFVGRAFLADLLQYYLDRNLPRRFFGFYLVETYSTSLQGVDLYMGFSLDIEVDENLKVNVYPLVKAFQSVKNYINYCRMHGISIKALKNTLTKYKNLVYLAPRGYLGKIIDVLPVRAGEYIIEGKNVNLSEYWKSKGIEVGENEKPLLKVKIYELGGIELVYPPSQCFFEVSSLYGESPAYKYSINKVKKESLHLVRKAIEKLRVFNVEVVDRASGEPALEKLASGIVGREVSLEGDVLRYGDRFVFLARRLIDYEY